MTVSQDVAGLAHLTVGQLQDRFAEVFGETTTAHNKGWLVKRIAWRLQANAEGGLTERIRQRATELADDANLRILAPRTTSTPRASEQPVEVASRAANDARLPLVGTVLMRPYKGRTVQVKILQEGFEYEGEVYASLSAVAKAITGSHCNGFQFFRLTGGQA